jgi:ABC-2 type transport system permease protein
VISKFLAALIFYLSLWLPSLLYFLIFSWLGNRSAIGSAGQLLAPYLLLLIMGMFNVALGCLASALTSNQIVAAMISLVLTIGIFFLTLINYVVNVSSPLLRDITAYVAQLDHMDSFSRGVIDSRVFIFYPSMTFLLLVITYQIFQYRRWRT